MRSNATMKIAMFASETLHSVSVGEVAVHVTELAASLHRRGHEVHIFTRSANGNANWEVIDGVHYHFCPFDVDNDFVHETNNMCRSIVHHFYEWEIVYSSFDLVHAHDWLTSNAGVWAKEGRKKKLVLTMHSTEYGRRGNKFFDQDSARIRDHERYGAYHADRIITVSHSIQKEVSWIYEVPHAKISTIRGGVRLSRQNDQVDSEKVRGSINISHSEFVDHGINGNKTGNHSESVTGGIGTVFQGLANAPEKGRNGRKKVESVFSWDKIAECTESVYRHVLS